jgi:parallel beta-helix repeat protein
VGVLGEWAFPAVIAGAYVGAKWRKWGPIDPRKEDFWLDLLGTPTVKELAKESPLDPYPDKITLCVPSWETSDSLEFNVIWRYDEGNDADRNEWVLEVRIYEWQQDEWKGVGGSKITVTDQWGATQRDKSTFTFPVYASKSEQTTHKFKCVLYAKYHTEDWLTGWFSHTVEERDELEIEIVELTELSPQYTYDNYKDEWLDFVKARKEMYIQSRNFLSAYSSTFDAGEEGYRPDTEEVAKKLWNAVRGLFNVDTEAYCAIVSVSEKILVKWAPFIGELAHLYFTAESATKLGELATGVIKLYLAQVSKLTMLDDADWEFWRDQYSERGYDIGSLRGMLAYYWPLDSAGKITYLLSAGLAWDAAEEWEYISNQDWDGLLNVLDNEKNKINYLLGRTNETDEIDELPDGILAMYRRHAKNSTNKEEREPVLSFLDGLKKSLQHDLLYVEALIRAINEAPNESDSPSVSGGTRAPSATVELSWEGGDPNTQDTVMYDVCFGTTANPPLVSSDQSDTEYDPGLLSYNTHYYWKVDAKDNHGAITRGDLWDFWTPNRSPIKPANPSPPDGAEDQPVTVKLNWTGGDPDAGDTVTYDVYFGKDSPPPLVSTQSGTTYNPGKLDYKTSYRWRVAVTDNHGVTIRGHIWDFQTSAEPNSSPVVVVKSPNGGEAWKGGKDISWVAEDKEQTGPNELSADLYWGTSATGPWHSIKSDLSCTNAKETSYSWDTTRVSDGESYYIRVVVNDGSLAGEDVSDGAFEINNDPPVDVTDFTATASDSKIALSWTNPSDADFVRIEVVRMMTWNLPRSPTDGTLVYKATGDSHTDTELTNYTTYYYTAFAYDKVENYSKAVRSAWGSARPWDQTPPTWTNGIGIQDVEAGNGQVSIYWNKATDSCSPGVKYNIYYNTDWPAFEGKMLETSTPQAATDYDYKYTITGLTNGDYYYFGIRAADSAVDAKGNLSRNEEANRRAFWAMPEYRTPGTGRAWTLDDMVKTSKGGIRGGGGSYTMHGDVTISQNDTLNIRSGDSLISVDTTGTKRLIVKGTLIADGQSEALIVIFASDRGKPGDWGGIFLDNAQGSTLNFCRVECARAAIYGISAAPTTRITDCLIQNNWTGLSLRTASSSHTEICGNTVQDNSSNGIVVLADSAAEVLVLHNLVQNNGGTGIGYSWAGISPPTILDIFSNEVLNNGGAGISCGRGGAPILIKDNAIIGNLNGIVFDQESYGAQNPLVQWNEILDNRISGVHCANYAQPDLIENSIFGNKINGVYSCNGAWPTLIGNTIVSSQYGVSCVDSGGADLGDVSINKPGDNNIHSHAFYSVVNLTSHHISAQGNWWGPSTTEEMHEEGDLSEIAAILDVLDTKEGGLVNYKEWRQAPLPSE